MKKHICLLLLFCFGCLSHAEGLNYLPVPANGDNSVCPMPLLQWSSKSGAIAYSLYLGVSKDDVASAKSLAPDLDADGNTDFADFELYKQARQKGENRKAFEVRVSKCHTEGLTQVIILNQLDIKDIYVEQISSWTPGLLRPGTTYYWRVDEHYPGKVINGQVLQFKVSHAGAAENIESVLKNPDMGWVLQDVYPIYKPNSSLTVLPDYDYQGCDYIALTAAWSDIEVEFDKYDFTDLDYAYDYWKSKGKGLHLRISSEPWGWWEKQGRGKGVPAYVIENMQRSERQHTDTYVGDEYTLVDARNTFYQERLEAFLKKLAEHYSPDGQRPVSLVDLRGFGVWGEWHSGFKYPDRKARRDALKAVIDIWSISFPKHWLALSYSHDPMGPKEHGRGPVTHYDEQFTETYKDFMDYSAYDYAFNKDNIAFRRDGCGGVVNSNERKLCMNYFAKEKSGPMASELAGDYLNFKYPETWRPFDAKGMIDDLLSLHPNYSTIPGWDGFRVQVFTSERPDLVNYGLRHMGYRFVPVDVNFPQTISPKGKFQLEVTWINKGVGKALRDYIVEIYIRNMQDACVASYNLESVETSKWVQGNEYKASFDISLPDLTAERYKIYIHMKDPLDRKAISLPLYNEIERTYLIGIIEVK